MNRDHSRLRLGLEAEAAAARHLRAHGLEVICERYRCRAGELDLVCCDGPALVIVEVRYRGPNSWSRAIETVDHHKRRRIVLATEYFLLCHPSWQNRPLRFDVVTIDGRSSKPLDLQWIRNAFDGA
jgi:putative endonuclease